MCRVSPNQQTFTPSLFYLFIFVAGEAERGRKVVVQQEINTHKILEHTGMSVGVYMNSPRFLQFGNARWP